MSPRSSLAGRARVALAALLLALGSAALGACGEPAPLGKSDEGGSGGPSAPPRCEPGGDAPTLLTDGTIRGAEHWECSVPLTKDPEGPALELVRAPTSVVNGGSVIITLRPKDGADLTGRQLIVATSRERGFHLMPAPLPGPDGTFDLELFISPRARPGELSIKVAVTDGGLAGDALRPGPWLLIPIELIGVKGGDVQVNVNWNQQSDVDLYVSDPLGAVVSFSNRRIPSGGQLDLDSNAACGPGPANENIFWDDGAAPAGEYIIGVNYYATCDVTDPSVFRVTLLLGGQVAGTWDGSLEPDDVNGVVREIARFTWPPP